MKKKLLVFAPLMALMVSGCFARLPTNSSGKAPTTTGTSGTSGSSSGSTDTSGTEPVPGDTYGTLDNPITVARALEIGHAIPDPSSSKTVFETKDAYVKGIVTDNPSAGSGGQYQFYIADSFDAGTDTSKAVQIYYCDIGEGVTTPIRGDEVVMFGRLANFKNQKIEMTGNKSSEIASPIVKKSSHVNCTITVETPVHGSITGAPASVQNGEVVSLTVTPDSGYNVEYVKANGVSLVESGGKYSFTAYTNTTITSSFTTGPVVINTVQIAYEDAANSNEHTFTGVVTSTLGKQYYVQDGGYGIYCRPLDSQSPAGLEVGKLVTTTAKVGLYNNLVETINNGFTSASVGESAPVPGAEQIVSFAKLSLLKQNVLVDVPSAVLVEKPEWTEGKSIQPKIKISDNDTAFKLNLDKSLRSSLLSTYNSLTENQTISVTHVVTSVYKTDIQVSVVDQTVISTEAKVLSSIAVHNAPTKLSYKDGEYFEPTGLVITRNYEGGTSDTFAYADHESEFSFSPSLTTALATSNTSVTITYGGKSTTQSITVAAVLSNITVQTAPTKTTYTAGEYFDPTGLVITRHYSDSSSNIYAYAGHESEFSFSPSLDTFLSESDTSVTITYSGKSTTQAITVNPAPQPKVLDTIAVDVAPDKVLYDDGECFDPTGLIIQRNYTDSTSDSYAYANHESEFSFSPSLSTPLSTSNTSVTITYSGKTCTQSITVKAVLASISVNTAPTKTTYTAGEHFDPTGLVINRTFSDSSSDTYAYFSHESEFSFSPSLSTALKTDDTSVTITYSGKGCEQSITVNPAPESSLKIAYDAASGDETESEYTFTGTIIGIVGNNFYVQDGEYGMYIYCGSKNYNPVLGRLVEVTATVKNYNGLKETATISSITVSEESGPVITPISVTSSSSLADAEQNVLATATTATVKTTPSGEWASGSDFSIMFTIGGTDVKAFFSKNAFSSASSALVSSVNNAKEGQVFALNDFVSTVNNNNLQLAYASKSSVSVTPIAATNVVFDAASYSVAQGDSIDLSKKITITPANSTDIPVFSGGSSTITVNSKGVVSVLSAAAVGSSAQITVTVGSASAKCTINVTGSSAGETVTIDLSAQGYSNGQEVATAAIDSANNTIVTFDKGTNSNNPKYYNTGTAVRLYGGNYMVVSSDKTIVKIVITFSSGEGSNAITTDVETYSDGTWSNSSGSKSVKFTVGGTSGHRRIKTIAVTYSA